MATASKSDTSTPRLNFVGPAAKEFETFDELTIFSLDTYWPNWRNYENPASYIIPRMFSFKDHEKSDFEHREREKEYQKLKATEKKPNLQPPDLVTKRRGDLGEFIVYEAITKCLREEKFAPFLAIQGLEVNDTLRRHFPQLFPEFGTDILKEILAVTREHDFILIGPSIGIVCIEVKSSTFSGQNDFSPKSNNLPDDIKSGIKQLHSFENFLTSICKGAGIDCLPVSKVLFSPHLEESRFVKWRDNLLRMKMEGQFAESEDKKSVLEKIEDITIWFGNPEKPQSSIDLYLAMIKVLNSSSRISNGHYEKLGVLMAGLASVLVLKNNISLEISKLSEKEAVVKADRLLDTVGTRRNVSDSQAIILTEDQKKAMKGPNRQFIFGSAGTGKTVVLRAIAQKLLKDGKSVVVLVSDSKLYGRKYFSFGEQQKCEIRSWRELILFFFHNFTDEMVEMVKATLNIIYNINDQETYTTNVILSPQVGKAALEKAKTLYDHLFISFDAIVIDDCLDDWAYVESDSVMKSLTCSIFIQVLSRIFSPSKVVWIAMDPSWVSDTDNVLLLNDISQMSTNKNLHDTALYGTVILKRVMRCSEKVFNEAYPLFLYRMKHKPLLGHKIPGSLVVKEVVFHVESSDLVLEGHEAFHSVAVAYEKLLQDGFQPDQIVIICGKCVDKFLPFAMESLKIIIERGRYSHVNITDSMVLRWNEVSSMEWPVVIYVSLIDWADRYDKTVLYERYRAGSRAQVKLIVIKGYFDFCKTSNEPDVYLGKTNPVSCYFQEEIILDSHNRYQCLAMNEFRIQRKFLNVSIRDCLNIFLSKIVEQSNNDRDKTILPTNVETGQIIHDTSKTLPKHLKDIFMSPIEIILETSGVKKEPQLPVEELPVDDETRAKLDIISSINRIVNILNSLPEESAAMYRRAIIRYCRILSTVYSHNNPIEPNIENIIIPSDQSHPRRPCCYCCSIL